MRNSTFLLIFITLMISACGPGLGDWEVDLPNDYAVHHINGQDIRISDNDNGYHPEKARIDSFIKEFSSDDRYVFARTIESIKNNDLSLEKYYVIDTLENKLHGPFDSLKAFENFIISNDLILPENWKTTQFLYNDYDEKDVNSDWYYFGSFLNNKWRYDLPDDYYAIESDNDYKVTIRNKSGDIAICSFVKEFMYVDNYIVTRNVDSLGNNNIFKESYYIFDTEQNKIYGIYSSYEELEQTFRGMGIQGHNNWLRSLVNANSK